MNAASPTATTDKGVYGYLTAHPLVLLLPICAAIALLRFDPNMDYVWDDSVYRLMAATLRNGQGLVFVNDPHLAPASLYPVGFPLLLTLISLIWNDPLVYKFVMVGLYL